MSDELKEAFPNIVPANKPLVTNSKIPDPNWLAGFTTAVGWFLINLSKSNTHKLKERVSLSFRRTQHIRDEQLIRSFIIYLDCKNVYKNIERIDYWVTNFSDMTNKIIPLVPRARNRGSKVLWLLRFL